VMDGLLNIRATPTSSSSSPFPGIILQPLLRALQFISDDNKTSILQDGTNPTPNCSLVSQSLILL
jgi:hypothetical protein